MSIKDFYSLNAIRNFIDYLPHQYEIMVHHVVLYFNADVDYERFEFLNTSDKEKI